MNVSILFIGDSTTTGVSNDNVIHTNFLGYRGLLADVVEKTYNFAVPGSTINDLIMQIDNNVDMISINKMLRNFPVIEEKGISFEDVFPTSGENISLISAIKKCDAIVTTIGENDFNDYISKTNDKITIDEKGICDFLTKAAENKKYLFNKIYEINPNITIVDVGIYFPFLNCEDTTLKEIYIKIQKKLSIEIKDRRLFTIANTPEEVYISSPNDIHPSNEGYHKIFRNIVNQLFISLYD